MAETLCFIGVNLEICLRGDNYGEIGGFWYIEGIQ